MESEARRHEPPDAAFHILLAALVAVFGSIVAAPDSELGRSLTSALLSLSLAAALWVASRSPLLLAIGFLLVVASALGWYWRPLGLPEQLDPVGPALSAAYFLTAAAILAGRVFRARIVTEDTLVGSICIYLLLAIAFACAYFSISQLDPGAFSARTADGKRLADFSYLSLVTMTTLGYGDITPVSGPARALAVLQSTTGVLYSAIAIARIVAVHASGGVPPSPEPKQSWRRQRIRTLFFALSALVLLPVASEAWQESIASQVLSAALLLAALYGFGGGRLGRIVAVPILVALVLRAVGVAPDGALGILANTLEVCVFGGAIALVARQAMFQTEVNREVLYAACALYVLIGIWIASAFGLVSAVEPTALSPAGPHSSGQLLYLSFMTVTTTGYGDVLPTHRTTELIAGLGACLGIFYPAILVARLVSLASQPGDA